MTHLGTSWGRDWIVRNSWNILVGKIPTRAPGRLIFRTNGMETLVTVTFVGRGLSLPIHRIARWVSCMMLVLLAGLVTAQDAVDLLAVEKALDQLAKEVSIYDKDAQRFLEKELKPLLMDPMAPAEITGVFVERLEQIDAASLGAFPEQFGYARSVHAALSLSLIHI